MQSKSSHRPASPTMAGRRLPLAVAVLALVAATLTGCDKRSNNAASSSTMAPASAASR